MCANILPCPNYKRNIHSRPEGNTQPLHYDNITLNCYITWWCFQRISILLCETLHQAILNYTTILFNSAPNCTILCFTVVYYAVAYYTILHYTILLYTAVYHDTMYCTVLYYTATHEIRLSPTYWRIFLALPFTRRMQQKQNTTFSHRLLLFFYNSPWFAF